MTSRTDSDAEAKADRDATDVEVGVRGPEGSAKSHRASPNPRNLMEFYLLYSKVSGIRTGYVTVMTRPSLHRLSWRLTWLVQEAGV